MLVLSLQSTNPMISQIDLTHHGVCTMTHSSTFVIIIHKLMGYISELLGVVYPIPLVTLPYLPHLMVHQQFCREEKKVDCMKDTFKINTFILEGLPPLWSSAWLPPLFASGAPSSSDGILLGRLARCGNRK